MPSKSTPFTPSSILFRPRIKDPVISGRSSEDVDPTTGF